VCLLVPPLLSFQTTKTMAVVYYYSLLPRPLVPLASLSSKSEISVTVTSQLYKTTTDDDDDDDDDSSSSFSSYRQGSSISSSGLFVHHHHHHHHQPLPKLYHPTTPPLTPPHRPFNARRASAQCRAIQGYVSFANVEGLGVPPDHSAISPHPQPGNPPAAGMFTALGWGGGVVRKILGAGGDKNEAPPI